MQYYIGSAVGAKCMQTMEETVAVLLDVEKLARIGFTTEFRSGMPQHLKTTSELVQAESASALSVVDHFAAIGFHRIS